MNAFLDSNEAATSRPCASHNALATAVANKPLVYFSGILSWLASYNLDQWL